MPHDCRWCNLAERLFGLRNIQFGPIRAGCAYNVIVGTRQAVISVGVALPRSQSDANPVLSELGRLRRDVDPVEASDVFTQDLPLDLEGQIYVVFLF